MPRMDMGSEGEREGSANWVDGKRHHYPNLFPQSSGPQTIKTSEIISFNLSPNAASSYDISNQ